jgi:hypothetical protein
MARGVAELFERVGLREPQMDNYPHQLAGYTAAIIAAGDLKPGASGAGKSGAGVRTAAASAL